MVLAVGRENAVIVPGLAEVCVRVPPPPGGWVRTTARVMPLATMTTRPARAMRSPLGADPITRAGADPPERGTWGFPDRCCPCRSWWGGSCGGCGDPIGKCFADAAVGAIGAPLCGACGGPGSDAAGGAALDETAETAGAPLKEDGVPCTIGTPLICGVPCTTGTCPTPGWPPPPGENDRSSRRARCRRSSSSSASFLGTGRACPLLRVVGASRVARGARPHRPQKRVSSGNSDPQNSQCCIAKPPGRISALYYLFRMNCF